MNRNLFTLILVLIFLTSGILAFSQGEYVVYDEKAVVLEVINEDDNINENLEMIQYVKIKMLTGKYKDEIYDIENAQSGNPIFDIPVKAGDKVMVMVEEMEDGSLVINISDYVRDTYIFFLGIIFIIILVITGGLKGFKTVLTLGLTILMIFKVLLPFMLKGYNPLLLTIFISALITIITILIIAGFNNKSLSAIIGTISGVIIAGLIAFIVGSKVKLTGLSSEEASMLLYIPQNINFNFRDLLFSGILLGALGAVMDVSMSIASSIEEISKANPYLTNKELFFSGMNVGKDIMGTMANTLILAYTGSSIPLVLLFMAYDISFLKIINMDLVATEIIRSLSGSIGLIMTIPITALVSIMFISKTKDRSR